MKTTKTFCILPFIHQYVTNEGNFALCCTSDDFGNLNLNQGKQPINLRDKPTQDEIFNSSFMKNIRLQMSEGKWPKQCTRCLEHENLGIKSRRQYENENFQSYIKSKLLSYDKVTGRINDLEVATIDYRLGNTCNLECQMCDPYASKLWIKDWNNTSLNKYSEEKLQFLNQLTWQDSEELYELFLLQAKSVSKIHLAGGEPFMIKNTERLLRHLIETGRADEIELSFNTNLTIIPKWIHLLSYFKATSIFVSIDGFDKVNSYIRKNSNWQKLVKSLNFIENNYKKLNLHTCFISCTVQVTNIMDLPNLIEFTGNFKNILNFPVFNNLHYPNQLRSYLINDEDKREIIEKLKISKAKVITTRNDLLNTFDHVIDYLNQEPSLKEKINLIKFIKKYDMLHTQFQSSEVAPWIKNIEI